MHVRGRNALGISFSVWYQFLSQLLSILCIHFPISFHVVSPFPGGTTIGGIEIGPAEAGVVEQ